MHKIPHHKSRESLDILDDDDNLDQGKTQQSNEKFHLVFEKNKEKSKSFIERVGNAIELLHGKTLAGLFQYVIRSIFSDDKFYSNRHQSGENISPIQLPLSEQSKNASLPVTSDLSATEDNLKSQSEPPIEAYREFNNYLENYGLAIKKVDQAQLNNDIWPNAKLYADYFLQQIVSEMESNSQYKPTPEEFERSAAAAALLGRKDPLTKARSPTQKQYLEFEKWHANKQLTDKTNGRPQTQADLDEAKIYAKWFLESKSPTFHPESVEAEKEKSAKYLIDNFSKISASCAKKESAPVVNENQNSRIDAALKNNELSHSDFYLVPQESNIPEKKISPEKKLSQRDILIKEYKNLLGIDPDEDMPIELIQELINKRKKDNSNEAISPDDTVLEYDSEQDDEIPMDDDSEDENDQGYYRTESKFLESILKNTSSDLHSNFNDGSSSQSNESLDSRMDKWKRDNRIMSAIRSENEEMLQDQRTFGEIKKNTGNLADFNQTENRPAIQASDAIETEFPLPTSLFVDRKLGPPPPPPPARNRINGGIGTNAIDAASVKLTERVALRNFPNVDHDQLSSALTGADADEDFNSLVYAAEGYFDSLASNSVFDNAEKTKALTLAKIWEGAAQESRRLSGMKALKDYELLNELLNSEKISKDFKKE